MLLIDRRAQTLHIGKDFRISAAARAQMRQQIANGFHIGRKVELFFAAPNFCRTQAK